MKNHILEIEKKLKATRNFLLKDSVLKNDIDFSYDFILPFSNADKTSDIKLIFIGQDPTVRRQNSRGYSGHIVPPIPGILYHWKQV